MRCQICNRVISVGCEEDDLMVPTAGAGFWPWNWRQCCNLCFDEYERGLRVEAVVIAHNTLQNE